MELSVVRIHKASASGGQPWVQARPIIHPDNYLSQCPFILLNEESHPPLSQFPIHSHRRVVTVTLVVDGSVEQTDMTGAHCRLGQGDAAFSIGSRGVVQGATPSERGVKLLQLWINVPSTLAPGGEDPQVVRQADACRGTFGDAAALLYAGTLGATSGPHTSPWPITVADLSIQAGKRASLPLRSTERNFAYILNGVIELGRNQVQLNRGNVAWIERTVDPGGVDSLSLRATKESRILLFSSPMLDEADSATDRSSADSCSEGTEGAASRS
jgi:redox-sensitive bicupin YhaK (pirin superfamily)